MRSFYRGMDVCTIYDFLCILQQEDHWVPELHEMIPIALWSDARQAELDSTGLKLYFDL